MISPLSFTSTRSPFACLLGATILLLLLLPSPSSASISDNVIDPAPPTSPSATATIKLLKRIEDSVRQSGDFRESFLFQKFKDFIGVYSKKYESENEAAKRFAHFKDNMKLVEKIQAKEKGTGKYGPNKFSDLSAEEFRKYFLSPKPWDLTRKPQRKVALTAAQLRDVPDSFDWREHNAVTPVKNQGYCGSCWAFSTTGNIEGQWAIRKGKLLNLSEQELVDCDKIDQGCNGGLPSDAYKEIIRLGGLETEADYPYDGQDEKCHFNKTDIKVTIDDSVQLPTNETELKAWLFHNGPISIGINANAMQFYWGGVSHPWSFLCSPTSLDHGVLIVGYGVDNGLFGPTPYWTIKNSWGVDWGEKGYYRIYRGDGCCGVNQMCTSAIVK